MKEVQSARPCYYGVFFKQYQVFYTSKIGAVCMEFATIAGLANKYFAKTPNEGMYLYPRRRSDHCD